MQACGSGAPSIPRQQGAASHPLTVGVDGVGQAEAPGERAVAALHPAGATLLVRALPPLAGALGGEGEQAGVRGQGDGDVLGLDPGHVSSHLDALLAILNMGR